MRYLLPLVLLAGTTGSGAAAEAPDRGREIYDFHCYQCHGYSGDAQTLTRAYIDPAPRNFAATRRDDLPRERMLASITNGRAGTAMPAFGSVLSAADIAAVVDFVRADLMESRHERQRYHTPENGWPDHDRYAAAFPFATGAIAVTAPVAGLAPRDREGRALYLTSCVSCHDLGRDQVPAPLWRKVGADGAQARPAAALTPLQQRGAAIFRDNCAFCHGTDGTGRNWIGSFLQPHPQDLTSARIAGMSRERLLESIRDGTPNTSMPAWGAVLGDEGIAAVLSYIREVLATGDGQAAMTSGVLPPPPQWQRAAVPGGGAARAQ